MFGEVIPFCYLPESLRLALSQDIEELCFEPGEILVQHSDTEDERLFLLLEGVVEVFDPLKQKHIGQISEGHYFGERSALFGEARQVEIRALLPSRVVTISGNRFLWLLQQSAAFAQAMGNILRHKQGVFVAFERFMSAVQERLGEGDIVLDQLLPLYRRLEPALHPKANHPDLDLAALQYAVRRLPNNVSRCLNFYVTETLQHHQAAPGELFSPVPTAARRRAIFELLPGKNMVLIRDGISDVLDFITCLCLYAIEAKKLRRRLLSLDVLRALSEGEETYAPPFSEAEFKGIQAIWPKDTLARLRDVVLHHEDIAVTIFRQLDNYNSAHAEEWSRQIASLCIEVLGNEPALLPDDVEVHIISSNTHSVTNCISPFLRSEQPLILSWARANHHPFLAEAWFDETDCVYALARDYFKAHPDRAEAKVSTDRAAGIFTLKETAFTGIEVQLVDCSRLKQAPALDPKVPEPNSCLLVNIDYAFGQQAEHIIANLIWLFGKRIRSVNVLGKAGALVGKRGDILAATSFVEQTRDVLQPIPNSRVDLERLTHLTDRAVHVGPILTVAGTLLQNRKMLQFNKHIWGCKGLEMEGTYYLAQVNESIHRGVMRDDVAVRFLYYVSDLPLDHTANLSGAMLATEGIPPLYAVTREILTGIFSDQGQLQQSASQANSA